ncbi:MAG: prepilin-type N-terminal cleavage/methylation domain-containing protein [Terracidiphilus sp.]|jgi:type IV pilus assembly protein PilA
MNRKSSRSCRTCGRRLKAPNGFTLMELLIVMAIIAILSLLAIASIGVYTKRANALSAVNSLQKIVQAQMLYNESYPSLGYACTLEALGGDPHSGPPTTTSAQLLPSDLSSGFKQGYEFSVVCGDKVTTNSVDRFNSFTVTAKPQTVGKTGDRGYCTDETGQIKFDPAGGANCTQMLGQ